MTEHKSLANYILDIVDITDFRSYLDKNELYFSTLSGMYVFIRTREFISQWCILVKKDFLKSSLS